MAVPKPRIALFIAVPVAILLLPAAVFGLDRVVRNGEVARNVSIAGVPLGGLGEDDALNAIQATESQLRKEPAVFLINGKEYRLDPGSVGFEVDEQAAVAAAMTQRRGGSLLDSFRSWLNSFGDPIELALPVSLDGGALDLQLGAWETDAIPNPAYAGDVLVQSGQVVAVYPRTGLALDHDASERIVEAVLAQALRPPTELPVVEAQPPLTRSDIDAAAAEVRDLIDDAVILRTERGSTMTFTPEQLARAVRVEAVIDPTPHAEVRLERAVIAGLLEPRRAEFETRPRDASFAIDVGNDVVTIVPSSPGTVLDVDAVIESLYTAATGLGFGPLPLALGQMPTFTTEDAEAFGSIRKVSEFATNHACCQERVENIHQMADTLDGVIVWPGQSFSVNDYVGERTLEKGYLAAPAIVGTEIICCDHPANIGGGVSQYATTLYNAVFFGCYEITDHTPHTLYISRYPEGREATLGFPAPDLVFHNDTAAPVIIRNQYTDRSITVKLYGNNGGKDCTSRTSDRRNVVPFEEVYEADEDGELLPGEQVIESSGREGWVVTVWRIVVMPDGEVFEEEGFTWRYRPQDRVIRVHPCEASGQPVNCPLQVPSVVGELADQASTTLAELGFVVVPVAIGVDEESQHGVVQGMDPAPWTLLEPGSSVMIFVGEYAGVADPPDDPQPPPP